MMVAIELVKNRRADAPDAELTKAVVQAAGRRGLILLSCGIYSNVIRILAPLTIPEAQLEEGLGLLEQSLAEASAARRRQATAVAVRTRSRRFGPIARQVLDSWTRGLNGANTPSGLNSYTQACSVHSWNVLVRVPLIGAADETRRRALRQSTAARRIPRPPACACRRRDRRHRPAARASCRSNFAVDQLFLHVVPAHVRARTGRCRRSPSATALSTSRYLRGGVAHLVELQYRERRRLLSLAGVGIVVPVSEGRGGEQRPRRARENRETS